MPVDDRIDRRGVAARGHVPRVHFAIGVLSCAVALLSPGCAHSPKTHVLFNGSNLAGWTSWLVDTKRADPRGVFSVTNGMIRVSGDGLGYLATARAFHNYHLIVEFKWGATNTRWGDRLGKARDSGVFLHATGPDGNSHDGNGAFMAAIECNVFEGATGDFLLIRGNDSDGKLIAPRVSFSASERRDPDGFCWFDPNGTPHMLERWGRVNWRNKSGAWRDELGFRGEDDVERPGRWNRLDITCRDARIAVRLNGVLVNEAFDVFPAGGKILLQCEGSEIFFRRVELREL